LGWSGRRAASSGSRDRTRGRGSRGRDGRRDGGRDGCCGRSGGSVVVVDVGPAGAVRRERGREGGREGGEEGVELKSVYCLMGFDQNKLEDEGGREGGREGRQSFTDYETG